MWKSKIFVFPFGRSAGGFHHRPRWKHRWGTRHAGDHRHRPKWQPAHLQRSSVHRRGAGGLAHRYHRLLRIIPLMIWHLIDLCSYSCFCVDRFSFCLVTENFRTFRPKHIWSFSQRWNASVKTFCVSVFWRNQKKGSNKMVNAFSFFF